MYASSNEPSRSATIDVAAGFRFPRRKHAAIRKRKASVLSRLVTSCANPPHRTPSHCTSVKMAITASATTSTARKCGARWMAYSPTTMATAAVVPQVEIQSLQPTMKPA